MNQENKLRVKAVVLRNLAGQVEVEISRPVECEGCGACLSGKEKTLRLPTQKEFHEGDTVFLEIACSAISKISFLLYLLPAVSAFIGFIAGYLWVGNLGGFIGAIVLLALNYLILKKYSDKKYKHSIDIEKQ